MYEPSLKLIFILTLILLFSAKVNSNHTLKKRNVLSKRSVLDQLSPSALKQLLLEINNIEGNTENSCNTEFEKMDNQIIRTNDSIDNGATFLQALHDITSASRCEEECCSFSTNRTGPVLKCNVAIYQIHKRDNKPNCFLFDCYNKKTGNFSCFFTPIDGFISLKSKAHEVVSAQIQELEDVAKETTTQKTTTMPTTTTATSTTTSSTTTSTTPLTTTTPKSVSTTTTTTTTQPASTTTADPSACHTTSCQRFEWQCDNKCCIPLRKVCDSIPHCSDGSDEIECPTTTTVSTTSTVSTTTTSPTTTSTQTVAQTSTTSTTISTSTLSETTTTSKNPKDDIKKDEPSSDKNYKGQDIVTTTQTPEIIEKIIDPEAGAVLPLAIGLAVTACVLLMVACRVRIMKRKLRRRGKPLTMDESDYLINGMYL